jgi:hypothetical protein
VPRQVLYDNMKTVVIERDARGEGEHRYHAGFLDYARHCGIVIKLCRPYRARTKGKVERFNGYLRRSFYVPLVAQLKQAGLVLDAATANGARAPWLSKWPTCACMAPPAARPVDRLAQERRRCRRCRRLAGRHRGSPAATRSGTRALASAPPGRAAHLEVAQPAQHPLAVYDQLLQALRTRRRGAHMNLQYERIQALCDA